MGFQLGRFRKGWKGEHLAKFILSKFSFVAEPSTISDDLGSDFFCTLFKIADKDSLIPQNSFAIQIKSSNDKKFEITNKLSYLEKLEIPFFIGIVDLKELKLTIYAGEYITDYFSLGPRKEKTFIHLVDERDEPLSMFEEDNLYIKFPKVIEIKADYDYTLDPQRIEKLHLISRLIQENISSKTSNEYVFKRFNSNYVYLYAGNTSVKHFRDNFLKRLAEVFHNLEWVYKNNYYPNDKINKEFKVYENLYINLQSLLQKLVLKSK